MFTQVAEGWMEAGGDLVEEAGGSKTLLSSSMFRIAARFEKRPLGSFDGIAVLFLGPVELRASSRKRRRLVSKMASA